MVVRVKYKDLIIVSTCCHGYCGIITVDVSIWFEHYFLTVIFPSSIHHKHYSDFSAPVSHYIFQPLCLSFFDDFSLEYFSIHQFIRRQ